MASPIVRVLGLNLPSGEYPKEITGFYGYHSELKGPASFGLTSAQKNPPFHMKANNRRRCREAKIEVDASGELSSGSLSLKDESCSDQDDEDDILRSFEEDLFGHASTAGVQHLRFVLTFHDESVATIRGLLYGENLYMITPEKETGGSVLSSLLDYLGETLECKAAIFCVEKSREDRALMMRSFMFMGFETLHPGHSLTCNMSRDYVFMAYALD